MSLIVMWGFIYFKHLVSTQFLLKGELYHINVSQNPVLYDQTKFRYFSLCHFLLISVLSKCKTTGENMKALILWVTYVWNLLENISALLGLDFFCVGSYSWMCCISGSAQMIFISWFMLDFFNSLVIWGL